MPVHGENKHLLGNAALAENLGWGKDRIIVARNGNVIEMNGGRVSVSKRNVPAAGIFVDGLGIGDIGTSVLKERKILSESGLIIVSATIDSASGFVVSGPEVMSRGFVFEKVSGNLIEELRKLAADEFEEIEREGEDDHEEIRTRIRGALKKYINDHTGRSPMIITILMEA